MQCFMNTCFLSIPILHQSLILIVSYPFIPLLCLHHLIILPLHPDHIELIRYLPTFKITTATLILLLSPLHLTLSQRSSTMRSYVLRIVPLSMLFPYMLNKSFTLKLLLFQNGRKQWSLSYRLLKTIELGLLLLYYHPVGCKWVYKIEYHANGTSERYKVYLVAKGCTQ